MKLLYQGLDGAYSYIVAEMVAKHYKIDLNFIKGFTSFSLVWNNLTNQDIAILPIENSYAGTVVENIYNFARFDAKIIGEIIIDINHCLVSLENTISDIHTVYSHPQAISQCYDFINLHGINSLPYSDTAGAAKFIKDSNQKGIAAISSQQAAKLYGLNILAKNIQDQKGNKTRFLLVILKESKINYTKKINKISVLFETRNIPASLYKCLGGFATYGINLTKIESLPSLKNPFDYMFWLDFQGSLTDENIIKSLDELKYFTKFVRIIGEY